MRRTALVEPATIHEEGYSLVVDHFVSFGGKAEETLTWIRPNFLALRYELLSTEGMLARISVRGIGSDRYVLGETATGSWQFPAFPLSRTKVDILPHDSDSSIGFYRRGNPGCIELSNGSTYQLRSSGLHKLVLETAEEVPVFEVEEVEHFPRWRVEMKIAPTSIALPELPLLAVSACCMVVFYQQTVTAPALAETARG